MDMDGRISSYDSNIVYDSSFYGCRPQCQSNSSSILFASATDHFATATAKAAYSMAISPEEAATTAAMSTVIAITTAETALAATAGIS